MPRFEFSLSNSVESVRVAGAVTSGSFSDALEAIVEQGDVEQGDTLEIGVQGFPPARFKYMEKDGVVSWRPTGLLAA